MVDYGLLVCLSKLVQTKTCRVRAVAKGDRGAFKFIVNKLQASGRSHI
ncbi:hypothetical protein [Microcoleus anatoxicus]|uniref:Uncharacterized protein n=1 Tax=Microcoleus anatoxicus PTRS2 TaxID=2705321 RepID=A0ABU8YIC5_9CYAN